MATVPIPALLFDGWEIVLMVTVALVLFGANKLPKRRNFVGVFLTVFGCMFCAVYGWSGVPEDSEPARFGFRCPDDKVHFTKRWNHLESRNSRAPGIPFAVKTNDESGNHYQVTGKLLQKAGRSVGFEQVRVGFQAAEGADGFSGVGPSELERGREWSVRMVAGLTLYGYSVSYANKSTPLVTAVPGAGGLAVTFLGIRGNNTIGGPPIPVGTPVYAQSGTNPPKPLNVKVGPGNTYKEPVGFLIPIVLSPSASEAQSLENTPTMRTPDGRITFTNKCNLYISGTNVGTLSRIVTLSNPSPGNPAGTVTIKSN